MANFKIGRGMQDGIPEALTDGMLYYCTDTTNLFIDYTDSNGNLVRTQLSANYADKLRYVADGAIVEIDPKDIALDSEVLHKNQPEQTNNIIAFIRDDDTIESPKRTYVNHNGVHVISSIGLSNAGADNEYWAFNGMAIDDQGIVVRKTSCPKGDYYNGASNTDRIKYNSSGVAQYWWLDTPSAASAIHVRLVTTDGSLSSSNALHSHGVAPACVIY